MADENLTLTSYPTTSPDDLQLLQSLVVDNPELEELESLLEEFNIFEALGAVRQEARHSDFLAFLLNPRQNHGLGDTFVKRLLQKAIAQAEYPTPITPIDLDIWDLGELDVRREWHNIDLLLLDEPHRLLVVIENKVFSGEHSNQLQRYSQEVETRYPGWNILKLFLTPEGGRASDPAYIPISYTLICDLVESLATSRASTLGRDVQTLMLHYAQMLRRHIMAESRIQELCQSIYRKHQKALDLIYEYRPDMQAELRDYLCNLIEASPELVLDHVSKTYLNFVPANWDTPLLKEGKGWTRSGRMLVFQFLNAEDSLKLYLILGPGPDETRRRLFEMVLQHEPPFKRSFKTLGRLYSTIFTRNFLTRTAYQEKSPEELKAEIERRWKEFLEHDLPKLDAVLRGEAWLWGKSDL